MQEGLIQGEGRGSPLLDIISQSSISSEVVLKKSGGSEWSRKQKRGYHRLRAYLSYWLQNNYQVLRVDLTTSNEGSIKDITYNFKRLRQMIEKSLGYRGLEYIAVKTNEGNGVLHIMLAWKPKDGRPRKSFYIPQPWLSSRWGDVHSSPIVWVQRVKGGMKSEHCISRYFTAQYLAGQGGYINMFHSWDRTFGFPLGPVWYAFKKRFRNGGYGNLYQCWSEFLRGEPFLLKTGKWLSLLTVKEFYRRWLRNNVRDESFYAWAGSDRRQPFHRFFIDDMGVFYG